MALTKLSQAFAFKMSPILTQLLPSGLADYLYYTAQQLFWTAFPYDLILTFTF